MRDLFWGFFFLFLNVNIDLGTHRVNLLPPFVGYLLLRRGGEILEEESQQFAACRPAALGLMVYSAVIWAVHILGIRVDGLPAGLLELVSQVGQLYMAWAVIRAIRDMEAHRPCDLGGGRLHGVWLAMVAAQVVMRLLPRVLTPFDFQLAASLGIPVTIVWIAALVAFLAGMWEAKKRYEDLAA